jgi:hypothetical protein
MNRDEAQKRLQSIKERGLQVLRLLETDPRTVNSEAQIRSLTGQLKTELEAEYSRGLLARAQKSMSIFELSVYSPTIEEIWKETGIRRLSLEGTIDEKWGGVLEGVVYKTSKYSTQ